MILSCIQEFEVVHQGQRETFAPGEPIIMPDLEAILALLVQPSQMRLISSAPPNPGCQVTWHDDAGQWYEGLVLSCFLFGNERWLFVLSQGQGWFVRESAITSLDAGPIFQAAHEAMERIGTTEARGMAVIFLLTIFGVPLPNPEAK